MSSREPPLQRGEVIPVQHHQTMLVVPSPVIVPQQDANAKFPMSYGAVIRAELMTPGGLGMGDMLLVSANFGRLVLGCIEADFCNQGLILQHFSRSTRKSSSREQILQNFGKILAKSSKF